MGWWTFPAPPDGSKKSLKGKKKFGTNWGSTIDVAVIRREFRSHQYREQNIGIVCGAASTIFVIETDTAKGHGDGVDGAAALAKWEAEHGALPETLKGMSPSGSVHRFFLHPGAGIKVKSFSAIFGPGSGVDCKGDGGMVIGAPSTRPGRGAYRWLNWGTPIAAAPQALLDAVVEVPNENIPNHVPNENKLSDIITTPFDHVGIPRSDGASHWETVNQTALANLSTWLPALFPGGATPYHDGYRVTSRWLGRKLQEDISALPNGIQDFGLERGFTPIDLVIEHRHCDKFEAKAWLCERLGIEDEVGISFNVDEVVKPTAPAPHFHQLEDARTELQRLISKFIEQAQAPKSSNPFLLYVHSLRDRFYFYIDDDDQIVQAIRTATGLGKSQQIIKAIVASNLKRTIYAVPNHYLSSEIEQRFLELDASVKIFRGMLQDDPQSPGNTMCLRPEEIKLVIAAKMQVSTTCCKYEKTQCEFFEVCGYQRQKIDPARVIVVASDTLFHDQPSLGKPQAVVIDEAIWRKALRGVHSTNGFLLPFNDLKYQDKSEGLRDLALILEKLEDGPLGWFDFYRTHTTEQHLHAIRVSFWNLIKRLTEKIDINPGLSSRALHQRFKENKFDIEELRRARNIVTLLDELSELLRWSHSHPLKFAPDFNLNFDIVQKKRSGRISIGNHHDIRGIRWRGTVPIVGRYRAPTLLLDATLPDPEILKAMFPNIEIVGDLSVDFPPSVRVRQYLGTPTSANKLVHVTDKKRPERYLVELRRHILQRWIETGRQPTLVIAQQKAAGWLKQRLPASIAVAHFNAISGLDSFKNIRLLIVAGRTLPDPYKIEAIAATISGAMPDNLAGPEGFHWYERVKRAIRLRDGTGRNTYGDRHPDPFVESIRWLVCEGELMQAIGRGRGINRTDDTPLAIDLLFNECLPGAVDQVLAWESPSALIEIAIDGVMLTSTVDLVRVWPVLWPNLAKAKRTISAGIPTLPGFTTIEYRLISPKAKTKIGYFDLNLIPDPQQWLEVRLGPLTLGRLTAASGSSAHFPYIES